MNDLSLLKVLSMKETLKQVIADQRQYTNAQGTIERNIDSSLLKGNEIVVISGVRRCGKSVLLQQIREKQKEKDCYINFDDDRLVMFRLEHFQDLYEVFIELFGKQKTYFLDEIQNIAGWERFVRRLYDEGSKVFVTGSNANLLSRELGTHLTGRYVQIELFPFSFAEYLNIKKVKWDKVSVNATETKVSLIKHFNNYIADGGFPQYIRDKNHNYLKSLYDSILYKDVMVRHKLTNEREMQELMLYLASSVAKPFSYTKLAQIIDVKHTQTVKNYISFIESTYLIQQVAKYDHSLSKQMANAKKVYFVDNSICNKLAFNVSENSGRLLENLVYMALRRKHQQIFYYLNKSECDFVVKDGTKIMACYQVCYTLNDNNRERELQGSINCARELGLKNAIILTLEQEDKIKLEGVEIHILPVWKWLLDL